MIEFPSIKSLMRWIKRDDEEEHLDSLLVKNLQREFDGLQKKKNMELQLVVDIIYSRVEENDSEYLEAIYHVLCYEGWQRKDQKRKIDIEFTDIMLLP